MNDYGRISLLALKYTPNQQCFVWQVGLRSKMSTFTLIRVVVQRESLGYVYNEKIKLICFQYHHFVTLLTRLCCVTATVEQLYHIDLSASPILGCGTVENS